MDKELVPTEYKKKSVLGQSFIIFIHWLAIAVKYFVISIGKSDIMSIDIKKL
jgi:hypothetical protein